MKTYTFNEAQLKGLMLMAAAHAPTYAQAEVQVDRVIREYNEDDSICRSLIDSMGGEDKT